MPDKLKHSTMALFADDSKCYRRIIKVKNCQELQDDINHILRWSVEWGMSFKIDTVFCDIHQPIKSTSTFQIHYE